MRLFPLLFLCSAVVWAEGALPRDLAAAHPEGKWKIRKADLYHHLVVYYRGFPAARPVLPDFMRRRLVESEAERLGITVTDADVDSWIERLDKQVRRQTGGTQTLQDLMKRYEMTEAEFRRRGRLAVLRERVARAIVNARDKTRDKERELDESTVGLVIDELYNNAPKVLDPAKLPAGTIATIGDLRISVYDFGRELAFALPRTEIARALADLVLAEEVKLLIGDGQPSAEDLAAERAWFVEYEMNRLRRLAKAQAQGRPIPEVTEDMVKQVLARRGLTLELALKNPASRAQAQARGHFRRSFDDDRLREYYEKHKDRWGDELKVQRILIAARAQRVGNVGQKIRTLPQGRAVAEAVWVRAKGGAKFEDLVKENSDDIDVIKNAGGYVPFLLTAATPGYEDTWVQANALKEGEISKPFFSAGRGYVIVRLVERKRSFGFEQKRAEILKQASEERYIAWRNSVLQASLRSNELLDKKR